MLVSVFTVRSQLEDVEEGTSGGQFYGQWIPSLNVPTCEMKVLVLEASVKMLVLSAQPSSRNVIRQNPGHRIFPSRLGELNMSYHFSMNK